MDAIIFSANSAMVKVEDAIRHLAEHRDGDWVSHSREYVREMVTTLAELGKTGPFWKRPKR